MSNYEISRFGDVLRKSDNATIPDNPANHDWVEYSAWVAAGNEPDPYVPTPSPALVSYSDLRTRLTDAERQAILTACRTSWQIDDYIRLAQAEGEINLDSVATAAAKIALIGAGLLTAERVAEVFVP